MKSAGFARWIARAAAALSLTVAGAAAADPHPWQLNLTKGVTKTSLAVYNLHMLAFWVCVGIGIVVFGAMAIAAVRFRKSRGAVPATWAHHTGLEIAWTIVPILILVGLSWPATTLLIKERTITGNAPLTVKVTGFQWKWRYDYVSYNGKPVSKVGFMSSLAFDSNKARQLDSGISPWSVTAPDGEHDYLLDVDHPLVLPTHTRIRFIITGGDVIHSWWVPDLGWKIDAIPGVANAAWANIDKPGVYRGQCTELCGQDHSAMPIVVKAVPKAQFDQWLAAREDAANLNRAARTAQAPAAVPPPRS